MKPGNGNPGPLMLLRPLSGNKRLLRAAEGLYHGLHVPVTVADFMADFVLETDKPFIADPSTYLFVLRPEQLRDPETRAIRPVHRKLAVGFGAPFENVLGRRALTVADFPETGTAADEAVQRVLAHQKSKFAGQMNLPLDPYYSKYLLYADQAPTDAAPPPTGPAYLIPPYFPFRGVDDPWYALNLRLAERALDVRAEGEPVAPTIHVTAKALEDAGTVSRVAEDYRARAFDAFFLWVNDLPEERATALRLRGLMHLVRGLSADGRRVFKLYGGYFSMLLFAQGLSGFTCGLGQGAWKNSYAYGPGGGGKPKPKFYVGPLHRSLEIVDAERLLREHESLRCACKTCQEVYGSNFDRFAEMGGDGHCEEHFLYARRAEARAILDGGVDACLSGLAGTVREFGDMNPLVLVNSLRTWREVLTEA